MSLNVQNPEEEGNLPIWKAECSIFWHHCMEDYFNNEVPSHPKSFWCYETGRTWRRWSERICGVVEVVGHAEQLLSAALDERVQRVLHQLQAVQLSLELLLVLPQEAGDGRASSATHGSNYYLNVLNVSYQAKRPFWCLLYVDVSPGGQTTKPISLKTREQLISPLVTGMHDLFI